MFKNTNSIPVMYTNFLESFGFIQKKPHSMSKALSSDYFLLFYVDDESSRKLAYKILLCKGEHPIVVFSSLENLSQITDALIKVKTLYDLAST